MIVHSQKGFTLVEVLVALFILVIGIIAVMQMLPTSLLQARMAAERSVGSQIARNVLGSIRAADAQSITTGALDRYDASLNDTSTVWVDDAMLNLDRVQDLVNSIPNRAVNPSHFYGYQTTIQPMNGSESTHLYKVTLVLDFADGRTESYVTYVSKL